LQARFVFYFSLIAIAPALLVAVFSSLFLNIGVQGWFSDRVRTAVSESINVAEAYVREHMQAIATDAAAIALSIDRQANQVVRDPNLFGELVINETLQRGLTESIVFRIVGQNRVIVAQGGFSLSLADEPISDLTMRKADAGEIVVVTDDTQEKVRALLRLRSLPDTYLFIGRYVDSTVLNHLKTSRRAVEDYEKLERERSGIEITFAMIFIIVALLLLFIAILVGFAVANRLSRPIGDLAEAAENIRQGNLSARAPESGRDDELGMLSAAFNRMTQQIELQQRELLTANDELDERRRFSEAVLEGVSAGVIGLTATGQIDIANRAASELLDIDLDAHQGENLADILPDFVPLLQDAIKNPLTPIQLSAERLKRRYLKQITDDPDTFSTCTDTIVRQVGDIRQMVDEFSNFARMPRAVLEQEDLSRICRDALFLQKQARPDIEFTGELEKDVKLACDRRQIGQAVTNLLQNAVDAIEGRQKPADGSELPKGRIELSLSSGEGRHVISVTDNGKGLPTENRSRLTEPYMTTRSKGTGLGLAIVKKIMEDHGGRLYLEDSSDGGARVRLVFHAKAIQSGGEAPQAAQ
jgi:two-component system nitrogen regulation sensor histidine kinase NtrY